MYKNSQYHVLAMLLDPRFREVLLCNDESILVRSTLLDFVKGVIKHDMKLTTDEDIIQVSPSTSQTPKKGGLWDAFDEAAEKAPTDTKFVETDAHLRAEIEGYLGAPRLERTKNPLEMWKTEKNKWPNLAKAAQIVLAIPATGAPSERVWSDAGNIVTYARQRLLPMNLRMLLFLRENL